MEVSEISYRIIADLLAARTGQQLTASRRWRVASALQGVFRERGIDNVDQLVCLLSENGEDELSRQVVEALLNNETYFYRDRPMFEQLGEVVATRIAPARAASRRLRIWSAGCSTGQEALTVAMLFADDPERWAGWTIDIVGTDVSQRAVGAARSGCYTQFEVQRGLGVAQMLSWFDEKPNGWCVKPTLASTVRFEQHNLLDPWPGDTRFDLVLCRNVLLYFDPATRARAFARLGAAMAPDAWLMLGAGETTVGQTEQFGPAQGFQGLYRPFEAPAARVATG